MILENLEELIHKHPDVNRIILNRFIYIKLIQELYGFTKIGDVSINSNEEMKVDEITLCGEGVIKLKKDLLLSGGKNES